MTLTVEKPAYRLEVAPTGLKATLASPEGTHWLTLRLIAAVDAVAGADETLSVEPPRREGDTIEVERRSSVWDRAGLTLRCGDAALEVDTWVEGRGRPTDVHLLGGRTLVHGPAPGFLPTGSSFRTLFTPTPADPVRRVRAASESAVVGVSGDGEAGRGHWLFTPAPLSLALTTAKGVDDPAEPVEEGWLELALAAPVDELRFVQLRYRPAEGGFSLELDYDGQTEVDGEFHVPTLLLTPGAPTPYAALRRQREELAARGVAPSVAPRERPGWWREPIFCGWGAQCHLARDSGRSAADFATQESYDGFLARLEDEGLVPGTVVIDDKWQAAYGTNEPDTAKWPDLAGWVAGRHERGQKVLLWWKAWDPEGLPAELCVTAPDGRPVAVDPSNPAARAELRRSIAALLSPDGLDADGLKIDFTARTPSGHALTRHGPAWGIALLHALLAVVYAAAKEAKPDALVMTHTPHPSFVDVTDMIRLNDMLNVGGGAVAPIVDQMRFRAEVARAACPELLIDTDDWPVPDLDTWRAYAAEKVEIGVPSLYYSTNLDATGDVLTSADYELLRSTWRRWRET
jgi:hypothetical protein